MNAIRSLAAFALVAMAAVAASAAQPAPPAPGKHTSEERQTRTFQILLLVAELQGSPDLQSIPANAQRALKDIQDFLPYKSYRLLDAGFVRSSFSARAAMSGLAGQTYDVSFVVRQAGERLQIDSFRLIEMPFLPLERAVSTPGASVETVTPRPMSDLLSTSFDMKVGETVVVGTSKLDGPTKALVVLLSALP